MSVEELKMPVSLNFSGIRVYVIPTLDLDWKLIQPSKIYQKQSGPPVVPQPILVVKSKEALENLLDRFNAHARPK